MKHLDQRLRRELSAVAYLIKYDNQRYQPGGGLQPGGYCICAAYFAGTREAARRKPRNHYYCAVRIVSIAHGRPALSIGCSRPRVRIGMSDSV